MSHGERVAGRTAPSDIPFSADSKSTEAGDGPALDLNANRAYAVISDHRQCSLYHELLKESNRETYLSLYLDVHKFNAAYKLVAHKLRDDPKIIDGLFANVYGKFIIALDLLR